jgi:hypothetical protein
MDATEDLSSLFLIGKQKRVPFYCLTFPLVLSNINPNSSDQRTHVSSANNPEADASIRATSKGGQ